jgi:hypothetical protein
MFNLKNYSLKKQNKIYTLKSFIKENNITHISISTIFKKLKPFINLQKYDKTKFNTNLLVFGLYNINDYYKNFKEHTGKIFIMFGGEDCTNIKKNNLVNIIKLINKTKTNTQFISISKDIYNKLKSINVNSTYIPLDFTDKKLTLSENMFRLYSDSYFDLINEVRELFINGDINLNENDIWIIESDLGKTSFLEDGTEVYLDVPFLNEDILSEAEYRGKKVNLNKPFRTSGGPKKFSVYVKNDKGNVVKVNFGDPNLKIKNNDKKKSKSFRARHKCDQKKDKTTPGYWSCNVGRYAKQLGLKSSQPW